MDQSPPKRMTRSRAAAKANVVESTSSTSTSTTTKRAVKKATTSTKARTTRAASVAPPTTATTTRKRKLRSDHHDDEDEDEDEDELCHEPELATTIMRATSGTTASRSRGRPKKAAGPVPEPEPETKPSRATSTRGRKKTEPATKEVPARTTRTTRTRKIARMTPPEEDEPAAVAAPVATKVTAPSTTTTRTTRTRGAMAATKASTAKAPIKKSVKFEEPAEDTPEASAKAKPKATEASATGLRAKPIRRAAAATRTTRATASSTKAGSAKDNTAAEKTPLSPKKVTQMPVKKKAVTAKVAIAAAAEVEAASEDELAMPDKTPMKKARIRPTTQKENKENIADAPANPFVPSTSTTLDDASSAATTAAAPFSFNASPARTGPSAVDGLMRSPPKRVETNLFPTNPVPRAAPAASSPLKEGGLMRSPAKRVELGVFPSVASSEAGAAGPSAFKSSLMQSPAKRSLFPKRTDSEENTSTLQSSPFKTSLLKTPARRGGSTVKTVKFMPTEEPVDPAVTPAPKTIALGTPLPGAFSINRAVIPEETIPEGMEEPILSSPSKLVPAFSGRLSSVLPRFADPAMNGELEAAKENAVAVAEPKLEVTSENEEAVKEALLSLDPAEYESLMEEAGGDIDLMVQDMEAEPVKEDQEMGEGDAMEVDDPEVESSADVPQAPSEASPEAAQVATPTPVESDKKPMGSAFNLRAEDLNPYRGMESDSEDDDTPSTRRMPRQRQLNTPGTGVISNMKTPKTGGDPINLKPSRRLGFTPLAAQLGGWRSSSPQAKVAEPGNESTIVEILPPPQKGTFFEDAMINDDPDATESEGEADAEGEDVDDEEREVLGAAQQANQREGSFDPFADVGITEEDMALATEANEMSLLSPEDDDIEEEDESMEAEEMDHNDDVLSEASQEYGDENALPIDPALIGDSTVQAPPVTPRRALTRTFHTVSKVPLKPADDGNAVSRPSPKQRRASAVSRLPAASGGNRPRGPTRNATVISYSPSKDNSASGSKAFNKKGLTIKVDEEAPAAPSAPVTPGKADLLWVAAQTPGRTPRPDVNPKLLKGAIVFVDVHTGEGADASELFIELLVQMGARCVKSWGWNPSSPTEENMPAKKIGITHVVFKDGSKRTMEKVRESGGVVQCVGVTWVLDCERENQWLEESPYLIDTSLIPRGGARRRKSMEPRALANLNGTLVSSKSSGGLPSLREAQTAPNTPANPSDGNPKTAATTGARKSVGGAGGKRRESSVWVRTPDVPGDGDMERDGDNEDDEWNQSGFLTPLPKTPSAEEIARFAANVTPGWTSDSEMEESGYGHHGLDGGVGGAGGVGVGARTCPPKKREYAELGEGVLRREKDEGVLMRLMAARRKSLQFAPKVGSPLARTWK